MPAAVRKTQLPSARGRSRAKIGLALAGGGPFGGIYQIGALIALQEALTDIDYTKLHAYVGVSSGGFVAAALANGISPAQMYALFIDNENQDTALRPDLFLRPAFREYFQRALSVPQLMLRSLWRYARNPWRYDVMESFALLGRAIPTGLFHYGAVDEFLKNLFAAPGRTNDFRDLERRLFLVATDLDTGESVTFGGQGWDHVPISAAIEASAALPGLFPPVEINGRYYVDGALKKTLHASVALDQGVDLLICINPLVPFDATTAARASDAPLQPLHDGGLPQVLSQAFRALVHSRMQTGMEKYKERYKNTDIVLFEPNRDDSEIFFANLFSYAHRRRLSAAAYQKTRRHLLQRRDELAPTLKRHGIAVRWDLLGEPYRTLDQTVDTLLRPSARSPSLRKSTDELRQTLSQLETWLRAGA